MCAYLSPRFPTVSRRFPESEKSSGAAAQRPAQQRWNLTGLAADSKRRPANRNNNRPFSWAKRPVSACANSTRIWQQTGLRITAGGCDRRTDSICEPSKEHDWLKRVAWSMPGSTPLCGQCAAQSWFMEHAWTTRELNLSATPITHFDLLFRPPRFSWRRECSSQLNRSAGPLVRSRQNASPTKSIKHYFRGIPRTRYSCDFLGKMPPAMLPARLPAWQAIALD